MKYLIAYLLYLILIPNTPTLYLEGSDATVWHYNQAIKGSINGIDTDSVIVYHNDNSFSVPVDEFGNYSSTLLLVKKSNKIWTCINRKEGLVSSDTIHLTLGYNPVPVLKPIAKVNGEKVHLDYEILENPYDEVLTYEWYLKENNGKHSKVSSLRNDQILATIPKNDGIYSFILKVSSKSDTAYYETYVKREGGKIEAFDIEKDVPLWMDEAVIYQVTPYSFVENGKFNDIKAKLGEIRDLGINTIWLQPISKSSYRGQGYDVIDYFSVNPDLGTEEELGQLVSSAKALGMRVLFDVVINHSSIKHPYAQDRILNGKKSHYFDFYQVDHDGQPYSSHYTPVHENFITYFWPDLVNFNYDNEEVRRWMIESCKYWIQKYDIDGYRLDAIWGINSRKPSFSRQLRTELKSLKPDLLLLAEDKGTDPEVYKHGYDAAYDWTLDTTWVSQWSWEYEYNESESKTVFNHPNKNKRGELLKIALFKSGGDDFRKLRFIENNDLHRFIGTHGLERTKMASALVFGIPGIPMLYNGQEIGALGHPYSTKGIFDNNNSITSQDKKGLYDFYKNLIRLRSNYPSLRSKEMQEINVSRDNTVLGIYQENNDEQLMMLYNLDGESKGLQINFNDIFKNKNKSLTLIDLLNDQTINIKQSDHLTDIKLEGYGAKWLVIKN
ncbi:MAG TPA: alpha-amylase family glycosyl hydrolase [Anditalea sp.]|nr:alpha-amylase family glycosyl hydrolase [Anditalea sp.]